MDEDIKSVILFDDRGRAYLKILKDEPVVEIEEPKLVIAPKKKKTIKRKVKE